MDPHEVEISIDAPVAARALPITCGVPWPRGVAADASELAVVDATGCERPLQARALDRWPDGSVRWALLDWQADVDGSAVYRVRRGAGPRGGVEVEAVAGGIAVDTGAARFEVRRGTGAICAAAGAEARLASEDAEGRALDARLDRVEVEEPGPVRACVRVAGTIGRAGREPLLDWFARLHFHDRSAVVRVALTVRNPRRAVHPGGFWELGDAGSVFLEDLAVVISLPGAGATRVRFSPEVGTPYEDAAGPLEIYQDSSGGENWKSRNHLNRHGAIPLAFRGYRLRAGGTERRGLRATPAVALARGERMVAVAMEQFWQNFPKAVEAAEGALTLRLFPRQFGDLHEIQGGEQKTHEFHVAFARDLVTEEPLAWAREPAFARASPAWYCGSGAVPYLAPKAESPFPAYERLVDPAIEGDDTFEKKREVVDEYGWRHFGDVWADHEQVYAPAEPRPTLSHYNNQYDPTAGCAYQFLRSGDVRWWRLLRDLARHVADIDVYHTDRDKAAYNHGLFWHTVHYVDAGRATHRSYPRGTCGGGPSSEHNYTTGLLLHHFLTGDPISRETVLELARWTIDMDDGRKTVFRWLARGATGLASATGSMAYHGPGRGPGNAINTLLDAHQLTGDGRYLEKADELIRRCIHPGDDIDARALLDAERRWYYTVFLQALGKYLDHGGPMEAYARESLLAYARWMAAHERPTLSHPEILEYPTETWAAQDMRKCEVFDWAARWAAGEEERERFRERAGFFFDYVTRALAGMETRTLARPVILLLSYGWRRGTLAASPGPAAAGAPDFGAPAAFVPQKARAKKRLVGLAAAAFATILAAAIYLAAR